MANELKFGNKVVFLNGHPISLPVAASDPGSAVNGDMYYSSASNSVRLYQNGAWASIVATEGAQTINGVKTFGSAPNLSSLTASTPLKLDASKNIISADIDLTADVSGVLPVANGGTNSSTALSNNRVMQSSGGAVVEAAAITAARALISDANGIPVHSAVTATELGYSSGVTSAIQTQINAKVNSTDLAATTDGASGASLVGIDQTPAFTNFTPTGATVQGALEGINTALGTVAGGDKFVKITAADTTASYLDAKLAVGSTKISKTILNPGANESISLDVVQANLDHGSIGGLGDDDHTQYHNDSRALTWLGTRSTSDLPEGTNKYYVTATARGDIIASSIVNGDLTHAPDGNSVFDALALKADISSLATVATSGNHTDLTNIGTNSHSAIDSHIASTSNPHAVTKTQVGLGNVTNDAQLPLTGGTMSGNIAMGGSKVTGLGAGSTAGDAVRYEQAILASGVNAFTAAQSMGGFNLTNVADPTLAQHAATKAYVDASAQGLKPKQAVRAATLVAGTLATSFENGDVIDGVTLATNDRILIKNQASASANGIYIVNASGAPTRATDFDSLSPIDEVNGAYTFIQEGSQAGQGWVQTGTVATLGTDPVNFVYFNDAAAVVGGDMITVIGQTISIDLATVSGLESSNPGNSAGQLRTKLEASNPSLRITGSNELAAKLDAAGAITSGASGLIVGTDASTIEINANALRIKALGIDNSHISASAAIAMSKLAALTANRALQSDGSGFISASSVTNTELGYLSGVTSAIQTQLNDKASKALDNLASVAINTSLISDTDNTDDLGSDAIEWKDLWVHAIKHNSSGTPDLSIATTGNNGSLALTAHGTGNLDIKATKLRRSENGASSNYMEDQYFDNLTLAANTAAATEISSSLSFAVASFDGAVINYRIKEATSGKTRVGQFIVTSDGTISSSSDQFSETAALGAALGLSLSADISSGNVRILYNNTHASNAATMRCHIRRLRA